MKKMTRIFMIMLVLILAGTSAMAAQWSSTSVSLLKGSGYALASSEDATIMTIEHASGWKYGDNFFFLDVFQPFDKDTSHYFEWHPRLSFGKMTQKDFSFGPVKDVSIATELNVSHGGRVYLYGLGFDLDIPHFSFFNVNFYIRDNPAIEGDQTFQISPYFNIPFTIGDLKFNYGGFLDYAGAEGDGEANTLTATQLLLDVSDFAGAPGNLFVGVEYQYWMNKYGVEDGKDLGEAGELNAQDNLVQLMVKWFF